MDQGFNRGKFVSDLTGVQSDSPRISGVAGMEKERNYFMRRAAQERSAADHASDKAARGAHLELERRYRELVGSRNRPEPGDLTAA